MRRVTLVPLCALLAAACQGAPMQPTSAEGASPPATFAAVLAPDQPNAAAVAVMAGLEDAATRLTGALEDQGAARQLGTLLEALGAHLAAGDRAAAERALTLAQGVLSRQGGRFDDAADLGSIQLALDGAGALLHGASDAAQE